MGEVSRIPKIPLTHFWPNATGRVFDKVVLKFYQRVTKIRLRWPMPKANWPVLLFRWPFSRWVLVPRWPCPIRASASELSRHTLVNRKVRFWNEYHSYSECMVYPWLLTSGRAVQWVCRKCLWTPSTFVLCWQCRLLWVSISVWWGPARVWRQETLPQPCRSPTGGRDLFWGGAGDGVRGSLRDVTLVAAFADLYYEPQK